MLVHRRVTPSIKFAGTHLYTWVERGAVRVKCLAHEHNAMSLARSRTQTTRSGVEHTNHEGTVPPTHGDKWHRNFLQKNSRNLGIVQLEILEIPGRKIKWIGKSQYIILLVKRNFSSTDIYRWHTVMSDTDLPCPSKSNVTQILNTCMWQRNMCEHKRMQVVEF